MSLSIPGKVTLYEVDFRTLTPGALANGDNTIHGRTWRRNGTGWTTCEVNATYGLQMLNSTGAGQVAVRLSQFHPDAVAFRRVRIHVHWDHAALGSNWQYLFMSVAPVADGGLGGGMALLHGNLDGNRMALQINSSEVASSTGAFGDRLAVIDYDPMHLGVAIGTAPDAATFPEIQGYTWRFRGQQTVQTLADTSLFFTCNARDWHVKRLKIEGLV